MSENEKDELELEDDSDQEETSQEVNWEEKAKEAAGRAKRLESKLKRLQEDLEGSKAEPSAQEKKEGFDYAEKAYLMAQGINPTEFEWVRAFQKESGKSLDDLLAYKYFQSELRELRNERRADAATPKANNRSTSASSDEVEYWIAKGELPPIDQPQLRRKVVNAKIEQVTSVGKFTERPIGNIGFK